MTQVDLAYAREQAEALMIDTVKITRDPQGPENAAMDPQTLKMVGPTLAADADRVTVYEGKARIHPPRMQGRDDREGGGSYRERNLDISIPATADACQQGDHVEVLTATNDPLLGGRTGIVTDVPYHSHIVTRKLVTELRS